MNSSIERLWPDIENHRSGETYRSPLPTGQDNQIQELKATLDELNASLEKANRRINRLLGEKTQLSALLEKRDEQLERLSRELGRYAPVQKLDDPGKKETSRLSTILASAFGLVVERARSFCGQWSNAAKMSDANRRRREIKGSVSHSLVARVGANVHEEIVGVLLFGLDKTEIKRLLPIVESDCSSRGMRPLFLIDSDAFELLRERQLIFEFLPPVQDRDGFDASLNWDLYLQRRLAIIRRKWNPVRLVAFGSSATNILTLWSSSPFEEEPLPTVLARPSP